jgi:hypothetical protein
VCEVALGSPHCLDTEFDPIWSEGATCHAADWLVPMRRLMLHRKLNYHSECGVLEPGHGILGPLLTRAKSRDHEIVRA